MTLDKARQLIASEPEMAEIADAIVPLLDPYIGIEPVSGGCTSLASRFGGAEALMLSENGWPTRIHEPYLGRDPSAQTFTLRYGPPEEIPLRFLAQVNFAELPHHPRLILPEDGLLSLFVD